MKHQFVKALRLGLVCLSLGLLLVFAKQTVQAATTYDIATDVTYPPFEYANSRNKYVGIDIDLIKAIAKTEGFKVRLKPMSFNGGVQAVESGQLDGIIAGMTITPERRQKFDFGTPYFKTGVSMAVAKSSHITSFKQLRGKRVALKTGTAAADYAESIKKKYGFKTVIFDDSNNMYQDVTTGNSVACFDDHPVLQYAVKQGVKIKLVGQPATSGWYGFAVKRGQHAALIREFNAGLKKLKANGTYDQIVNRYLSSQKNPAVQNKTFQIATDVTFPPFEFANAANHYVGIDMDLIRAIAKDQGFKLVLKPMSFNGAIQAVQSGQMDGMIAGMSITPERQKQFNFSKPYFNSGVVMAVKSHSTITKLSQLHGKKVAIKTGTAGADYANSIKKKYGFKTVTFDDSNNMYQDVITGNSVACFDDHPVIKYAIHKGTKLRIVTKPVETAPYGFAVKRGHNAALLAAFNTGLANLEASGQFDQIKAKYLGAAGKAMPVTADTKTDNSFFGLIKQNASALGEGLQETLLLSVVSIFFATIFGIIVGLLGVVPIKWLNWLSTTIIYIFRGLPLLVLALFIYTGIPSLTGEKIPAFVAGVITLAFNEGAYTAAFVKGGIAAVDPGQMEAARSLGLPFGKAMRKVILPQGLKIMVPSFINQFIITLKDTSILSVIGLLELTQTGKIIIARNLEGFAVWTIIALMYLILITLLTWLSNWVQRRMKA